ncbi:MAG: hypothetical protein ACXWWP_06020 [Candidatus Binatia bacterium]
MALREHPQMQYRGAANWPPMWTQAGTGRDKTASGEVGILRQVNGDSRVSTQCYLVIEHEAERYVGAMVFDNPAFCRLVYRILKSHIGTSIRALGDLNFSSAALATYQSQSAAEPNRLDQSVFDPECSANAAAFPPSSSSRRSR